MALLAGVVYGISSGFGLPFMASKVFPLLFASGQQGLIVAVASDELKPVHYDLGAQENFGLGEKLYRKAPPSGFEPLPESAILSADGACRENENSEPKSIEDLYFSEGEDKYQSIQPKLYVKTSPQEYKSLHEKQFIE